MHLLQEITHHAHVTMIIDALHHSLIRSCIHFSSCFIDKWNMLAQTLLIFEQACTYGGVKRGGV